MTNKKMRDAVKNANKQNKTQSIRQQEQPTQTFATTLGQK